MSKQALKFVDRAERYSRDRKRLAGDGESVARYVLNCAERVSMLDDRVFTSVDRESCMARIWDAYGVVTDYLSSNAPADLDSPERAFYGDMLGDMGAVHGNATDCEGDWHGCEGQATVDLDYYGEHQ
jgi:hypothetical protein